MNIYEQLPLAIYEVYLTKQRETFGFNIVTITTGILLYQQKQTEIQFNQNFENLNFIKHGGHTVPINLAKA